MKYSGLVFHWAAAPVAPMTGQALNGQMRPPSASCDKVAAAIGGQDSRANGRQNRWRRPAPKFVKVQTPIQRLIRFHSPRSFNPLRRFNMENNALIQYGSTQDSRTFHAVRQTEQICAWTVLGIGGFLLLVLIANVLSSFFKHGIGEAILALLLVGVVLCLVFVGVTKLLELLVFKPWKAVRYSACAKRMAAEAQQNGLRPVAAHQWTWPQPGVLALDRQNNALFACVWGNGYERLLLSPREVIGMKVERESEIHTDTKHGGSFAIFSSGGWGYQFGSRSKSKSVTIERAFLEIHYQREGAAAPGWVAVPYGEERREADSMAVAIQQWQRQ